MKRFFKDLKKFRGYTFYAVKSELKSEVATSHLNWLWWILDPIMFMFVYGFIVAIVFKEGEPSFPVFILVGLTVWNMVSGTINMSTTIIDKFSGVIKKIYIPKFILIIIRQGTFLFKFFISSALILVVMLIIGVPYSLSLLNYPLIVILMMVITFGFSSILAHVGVFLPDLSKIMNIVMRMLFYMSGVFFNVIDKVPAPWGEILGYVNPFAFIMKEFRVIVIDGVNPDYMLMGIWFLIGIILSVIGISLIYRYENTYVKVL